MEYEDYDYCYECTGNGDDCYYDDKTDELISNCMDCPFNPCRNDDWDD